MPGKEETLRVVFEQLMLYVPGEGGVRHGVVPEGKEEYYSARREHVMSPGEQFTIPPGTKHWFQVGDDDAVVLTLSTRATDDEDLFSDPKVVRLTRIGR
jgi:D-lyxose ketol-isomerase